MLLKVLKEGRPLYQHGIRDLKLPIQPIFCGDENCEFCAGKDGERIEDFKTWAPSNALIVLDEVQRQYRVRGRAAKVPQFVGDLETHRHLGVDFIMVTQDPRLLDQNIRRLVTMHHHLEPGFLGSIKATFMECRDDPKRGGGGVRSKFTPPKEAFQYYKSAELHTKIKKPIPKGLYIAGLAVLLGVVMVPMAINAVRGRVDRLANPSGVEVVEAPVVEETPPGFLGGIQGAVQSAAVQSGPDDSVESRSTFDFDPAIPGVLESAPAYVGMVSFRDHPRRAACLQSGSRCRCYTQQGTDYPTTLAQCQAFIQGRVSSFNPYQSPASMYQASPVTQ